MSPIFLMLSLYAVLLRLLWPLLSIPALVLIGLAALYSLMAMVYIQTHVAAEAGGRASTATGRMFDLALPLFGATIVPAPYLAGALAVLWGFEGRGDSALRALLAGALAAGIQYAVFRYMRSRIESLPPLDGDPG